MTANPVTPECAHPHACPLDVRLAALARSPLTRALSATERLALDGRLTATAWGEGEPLMLAGQKMRGSYLVVAGAVRIARDTAEGREITVDIAAPGDIVGPLDTEPSPALDAAWALETTCALYLPASQLAEVISAHPDLALAIVKLQQERLVQAREQDVGFAARTVAQRVAAALLRLDAKFGEPQPDGSSLLGVRLRRSDIAGMAGTTLESTSRTMTKMKQDSVIDSGRQWVALTDRRALHELAEAI